MVNSTSRLPVRLAVVAVDVEAVVAEAVVADAVAVLPALLVLPRLPAVLLLEQQLSLLRLRALEPPLRLAWLVVRLPAALPKVKRPLVVVVPAAGAAVGAVGAVAALPHRKARSHQQLVCSC